MERLCRFLQEDGQCKISDLEHPSKITEKVKTEMILSAVVWNSFAVVKREQLCGVQNEPTEQINCDCFVWISKETRERVHNERVSEFQEG